MENIMKKNLTLLFCTLLTTATLTGCGQTVEKVELPTSEDIILTEDSLLTEDSQNNDDKITTEDSEETGLESFTLYIALGDDGNYTEVVIETAETITPDFLIAQISEVTNWDLTLNDAVTTGKGGMTVSFAPTCALYVGPPDPQTEAYFVYDQYQLTTAILNSIQKTLQCYYVDESLGGDPNSLDIYYCGENDTPLYFENIGASVPLTEPYSELIYSN